MLEFCQLSFPERASTELLMRLNAALQEFADATELTRKNASLTSTGTMWLTLPTDFGSLIDIWLEVTSTGERSSTNISYEIARNGGSIRIMDKYDKRWILVPASGANYAVKLDYVYKPAELTDVAGITVGKIDGLPDAMIPIQYHDAICYRAIEPLYVASGKLAEAKHCMGRYEEARRHGKAWARRNYSKTLREPLTEMEM